MRLKRVLACLAILGICLVLAAPAEAQLARKQYRLDFFGLQINAPFNLVFIGTDCMNFISGRTVCMPAAFNDCGSYEITEVDGGTIHFTAQMDADIGSFFSGPVTITGAVDRAGAGSSIGFSFFGRFRSGDLSIPPTGTNGSGHGVQGCVTGPVRPPEENWVRE